MKLTLPKGTTGFYNERFEWICTGSQIGRQDVLPASTHLKLRLQRLPFVGGDYDRWGAYWGWPANVFVAWDGEGTLLFRRAESRDAAKAKIQEKYPHAKFHR